MTDKKEYVYLIEFNGNYNRLVKAERLQKILADGSVSPNALLILSFLISKAIAYLFLNNYFYHDFNSDKNID